MKAQDLAELTYHLVCLRSLGYRTARDRGLAPREYELLLAIKAPPPETRRGIGELADWLHMQHHGVVELATRLERRGLLRRYHDQHDGRQARLALTPQGARLLQVLVEQESAGLRSYGGKAVSSLRRIVTRQPRNGNGGSAHRNGNGNGRHRGSG
jgi:DNA-binding MarR family transcriptional regulator